ncbi:MAG: glycine zipper 2TM domain-containing protein [Pseudomonadota bacterium]
MNRINKKAVALALTGGLVLSGCAVSDSNTYSREDVGRIIETSEGRVLSWRPVTVESENSPLGTAAGGAAGGVIGNTIGAGSGNTVATVAGVLIGAGIGYLTERELRSNEGLEYIVEMEDGRTVTIVQNGEVETAIPAGSRVLIQFGYDYTRVTQI